MSDAAQPRRLLFLVQHFRCSGEGAENDAVNLCQALAARGYEVHVAAEDGDPLPGVALHCELAHVPAVQARVKPDVTIDWGFYHEADLHRLGGGIHQEFQRYNLRAYPWPLRWVKWLRYRGAHHRALVVQERRCLTRPGAHFLAISEFVAAQARRGGAPPTAVSVIYTGVDTVRFSPAGVAAARQETRQAWGVGPDDPVFLFVAHNLRLKNLALLRQVGERLAPEHPTFRLVVVGKRRPGFRAPWLVYAGTTPQIERFYGAADALLHPSFFDAFGNVVLEAMGCGLPVVVSEYCGAAELLRSGENGLVLPVSPPHLMPIAWASAVAQLATDPAWRRQLGEAARATAVGLDFPHFVDKVEALLAQVYRERTEKAPRP